MSLHLERGRRLQLFTWIALMSVVLGTAACGGGSKKTTATAESTTTVANASGETTEPIDSGTTSTTPSGVSGASSSTTAAVGRSTTTAKKKVSTPSTFGDATRTVAGGITNITAAPTTQPAEPIQPGGTITFLKTADIGSFDPIRILNVGASDGPVAASVFDMLLYSDMATGSIQPQTAESLTSTDGSVWTLKLRPNIKFSDGNPYDAAAVKFNWERQQDPKNAAARASLANQIATMEPLDPQTLRITLKAKSAVFPTSVMLMPFIGSPAAIQERGTDFASNPVGAGPFLLKNWVRDSQMTFQRNPLYWNAPRPYADQLIMKIVPDTNQRLNTYLSNGGNVINPVVPEEAEQIQKAGEKPRLVGVLNGGRLLYFNVRKPPFNDIRARQAILLAIDRADYTKIITNGIIEPADSIFRKTSPYYDASITPAPYDPVKAQALLDALAADTGGPLTFTLYTINAGAYVPAAQYIQATLSKLKNIKVNISSSASPAHISRINSGDYGAALFAIAFDDPEPSWTGAYTCDAAPSPTGFCDSKFDALIADNRLTLDPKQRVSDLKEAQKILYAQLPSLPLERRQTWLFAQPSVEGATMVNDGLPLFDGLWFRTR